MSTALKEALQPASARPFEVRRLGTTFGAEISGVDLGAPLDEPVIEALRQAHVEHKLIIFRDQKLTPESHRDFAAIFGPLHVHPLNKQAPGVPEIMRLEFDEANRNDHSTWHADVTFIETPPLGSVLHGIEIPDVGGDTVFADAAAAFQALSPALREFLRGLRATHDFAKSFTPERYATPEARARWERTRDTHPPVSHPVIRTHPETGEEGIFVNEGFTVSIDRLSKDESDTLLAFLFAHIQKPEFAYRHRWRTNDVLFWDNRITQHYAVIDYWPRRRVLHRATVLGDRPV